MSKPTRLLTAILVSLLLGGMFAYQDAQKNEPTYQQHPVTVVLTDFFGASLSGLIFYFGSGWIYRRKEKKLQRAVNDKYYDEVARELQEKPMVPGLWTKAFAEMGGDDAKARALYIKFRVAQLAEAGRQALEKDWLAKKQQEKPKRIQSIKELLPAAFVFVVAIILVVVWWVMTSNNNVKDNASAITPTEHEAYDFIGMQKTFANRGDANAAYSLGTHYDQGLDVHVDKVEAYKWYSIAVALGSENARKNITNIASHMTSEQIATAKQLAAAFVPQK